MADERDLEPDVRRIMQEVRRRVTARQGIDLDPLIPEGTGRFDQRVHDHLFQAWRIHDRTRVELLVSPSKVPLLGTVWQAARRKAHQLVLFYLDRLAEQLSLFHEQVVRTIQAMIQDLEAEPRPLDLASEFERLEHRVARLEARLEPDNG